MELGKRTTRRDPPGGPCHALLGPSPRPSDADPDDWNPISDDDLEGLEDAEEAQPERGDFSQVPDDFDD